MADEIEPSAQWRPEAVLARLQAQSAKGEPLSVQVSLSDGVDETDVARLADEITQGAAHVTGAAAGSYHVGRVFPLAKSFSVQADKPDIFREILKHRDVKSLIESQQPDILPKPLDRRVIE